MGKEIAALKPEAVWKRFHEITQVPRPSHHEEKIEKYLVDFAKTHGIECKVDDAGNVYMYKPATKGMENRKGIIMQAHQDMVPQKNKDKEFDFEKDAIQTVIDGEWVTADGTTLGADNGIGVAAALAVMEDEKLEHGSIEALFTRTEETGMNGAFGLKAGLLKGDILLNLDSETWGEFCVGCAGGLDVNITAKYRAVKTPRRGRAAYAISVTGLKGGHSGIQIDLQRANANKILFRYLYESRIEMLLASVDGGGLRNAIPREATATVVIDRKSEKRFLNELKRYCATVNEEYAGIEDKIIVTATACDIPARIMPVEFSEALIRAVVVSPDGVAKMSTEVKGLVEASNNLARVVSDGKCVRLQSLVRSSSRSEKFWVGEMLRAPFELLGANVRFEGAYDGWQPNMNSAILEELTSLYRRMMNREPLVKAIHAGLECGIIGGVYPNLDMISFGPTICYPHSPAEQVEVATVAEFYDFLKSAIKSAPAK